jgi:hypothetical protein
VATPAQVAPAGRPPELTLGRRLRDAAVDARGIALAGLAAGVALRLVDYVRDSSLRFDEALLALNLLHPPRGGVTGTLDFHQAAPFGFVLAERWMTQLFGSSELVLRALPELAGIASCVVFFALARKITTGIALVVACVWFATSAALIFYAADTKQYSFDVVVCSTLLLIGIDLVRGRRGTRFYVIATLMGLVGVWFSHASLFVAATVGVVLAVQRTRRGSDRARLLGLAPAAVWGVSSLAVVLTLPPGIDLVRGASSNAVGGAYPGDGRSGYGQWLKHAANQAASALSLPTAFPQAVVTVGVAALIVAGLVRLLRRRWELAALLALPGLLELGASWRHLYPTEERTILFLVPALVILAAEGVAAAARSLPRLAIAALAGVVLASPAIGAGEELLHPPAAEETQATIRYAAEHWRRGDTLYLHYAASYPFAYDGTCGCAAGPPWPSAWRFVLTRPDRTEYPPPLTPLGPALRVGVVARADSKRFLRDVSRSHGRIWILTSHASDHAEKRFLDHDLVRVLSRRWRVLARLRAPGSQVFLVQLPPP